MDPRESAVRVVTDTNVVAYYLADHRTHGEEARLFWRDKPDAIAPASWEAEILNVIWFSARQKVVPAGVAAGWLEDAGRLGVQSVPVRPLLDGALKTALRSGIAAYDTLFVELALRRNLPLATFDAAVLAAFPGVAMRPRQLLRKRPT